MTPSQSIKNGSFETWVLVVVSTLKVARAEATLPSYLYPSGVDIPNSSSSLSIKLEGRGKKEIEDSDESDPYHQTLLSSVILN